MSRGGNRPGAGRKSGTPNKASVERQKKVAATGDAPLEYTLEGHARQQGGCLQARRDGQGRGAICAPKLAAHQHTGPRGGPIPVVDLTKLSGDELDRLERIFGPLAGFGDDDAPDQAGEGAAQG